MPFSIFMSFVLFLVFTERIAADDDDCMQYFKKKGYVPKLADTVKSSNIQVEYGGKNISCGSTANVMEMEIPPKLYYNAPSCCRNITVIGFSPDTPFFPPYLVWLINNLPPENLRKGFTTPVIGNTKNNGDYVASYDAPKSPTGSVEPKAFAIFVYCQCGYFKDETFYAPLLVGRSNFDMKGYAKKYRLGNPMAAYYLRSTAGVDASGLTKGLVPHITV